MASGANGGAAGPTITLPEGTEFELPPSVVSPAVADAAQTLIEREARVLSAYAPDEAESPRIGDGPAPPWAVAWRRYFRMIYRDSFSRLEPVAEALFMDLARAGCPPRRDARADPRMAAKRRVQTDALIK